MKQGEQQSAEHPVLGAIAWVHIPAGEFLYGEQQETKYLPDYAIMKYPVTVLQYRLFCEATDRSMPTAPGWGWLDDHPVVNVSWHDAMAFAAWAGVALPSEEEWEKAARGTDGRKYPWGDEWNMSNCKHSLIELPDQTSAVGAYPAGASPYGVMDMTSNVWEWCDNRNHNMENTRVLRGGCWINNNEDLYRVTYRYNLNPGYCSDFYGFRCIRRISA